MKDQRDKTVEEMLEYSERIAQDMLRDMDEEEAVHMVREFCHTMMQWQPEIEARKDSPVELGISCLATAELFRLAFAKAYTHIDKKVDAINAIKRAFDS